MAAEWYGIISTQTSARAVWIALPEGGSFLAVSTPESDRMAVRAWELVAQNLPIPEPEWFFWQVFYFPGVTVGNVAGIAHCIHGGHQAEGRLADVFDEWADNRYGRRLWRTSFAPQYSGPYWLCFRECLLDFGVDHWIELVAGRSWEEYRCLDLCMRYVSKTVIAPSHDAWYLLGSEIPPQQRIWVPGPEDWWKYTTWRSYGQKEAMPEYDFKIQVQIAMTRRSRL
jgi:hypothetical protein